MTALSLPTFGAVLLTLALAAAGAGDDAGHFTVDGRAYRDVIATCRLHPFLTDADVLNHVTDTRGRVSTAGGPVMFSYPGIEGVVLDGEPLPVVRSGPNLLQVPLPAGTHDVEVVASPGAAVPDLPTGFAAGMPCISSLDEFRERVRELAPGQELVLKNGIYTGWTDVVVLGAGTAEKPVLIRPQTPGGVIFQRRTHIQIRGKHVVLKGFRFENAGTAHLLYLTEGEHIRVTQCQFFNCGNSASTFSHIVRVTSNCHRSRVDHWYFTGSKSMSIGLRIHGRDSVGVDNRFDHNIFRDIFRVWGNGQENIQLGGGAPEAAARCTVEYCLFDHAWGDSEVISNKSSSNVIRYNVAAHCLFSAFTLRQGSDVRFEGNVMTNNAGGLRVYGRGHIVVNNLFMNLSGHGVALETGSRDGVQRVAAQDTLLANNTFVTCRRGAIGSDRPSASSPFPARGIRVSNNLLTGTRGTLLDLTGAVDTQVERNLFWPTAHARGGMTGADAIVADPHLEGSGIAIQPAADSPAVDRGLPLPEVTLDRWQRRRPHGAAPDVGADEAGAGDRPTGLLPAIPPRPLLAPELYKKEFAFAIVHEPGRHEFQLVDEALTAAETLPADFVMEWDYTPETFASQAALTFSATADDAGYTVSWGGVDDDGVPFGLLTLRQGASGETVADGADVLCHRMSFRSGRSFEKPTGKRPAGDYAFTLIKHGRLVWLGLRPLRALGQIQTIPVLVWYDREVLDGSGPVAGLLRFSQTGSGVWRNVNVWRLGRNLVSAPPKPVAFVGTARGARRICLRWRHGAPGRGDAVYDIYRGTSPDLQPTGDSRIASGVRGTGYDDFGVAAGSDWHYLIRARNVFEMTSGLVSTKVGTTDDGPFYACLEASSARDVRAPMVVHNDPDSGDTFLWAPPNSGSPYDAAPEDGSAAFVLDLPAAGRYSIWLSTQADGYSEDSFYISLDSESISSYRGFSASVQETWSWRQAWHLELAAGEHTVRIKHREPGARLKAVLITDDPDFDAIHP